MSATIQLSQTTCRNCGQVFCYEPILVMGMDLGKSIHHLCDYCIAKDEERVSAERETQRREEIETTLRATIPWDLIETDEFHPNFNRALWQAVANWRPTRMEFWLAIIGPAAQSKTRCMAMLAMKAMRRGTRVVWTTANRLRDCVADKNHKQSGDLAHYAVLARQHLAECLHAPVLFIDDLGKNEWTGAFESQFFQILDHRKNHRLPTIYSSNAHPEAFSLVLSDLNREPIIGRLLDRVTLIDLRPKKL